MFASESRILICSQDTLFIKGIYAPLRDTGFQVETVEHPNEAVQCVLGAPYLAVILDSRDIGLNAGDAASIIKTLRPDTRIVIIGADIVPRDVYTFERTDAIDRIKEFFRGLSAGAIGHVM